jgi:hypothetical protein
VSDLTAEDYARVATEIGMVRLRPEISGLDWHDPVSRAFLTESGLARHLAEPAQMVRIMEELKVSVRFDVELCHWIAETLNATGEGCHWVHGVAQDKPGLAVLDCAARALRP